MECWAIKKMDVTEENKSSRSPLGIDGTPMFFVGEDILIKGKVSH